MHTPKVLFVCLGNICRSPTAEAVFRARAEAACLDVHIESAGTSGWHIGEPPDPRSIEAGQARGYSFAGQASRKVTRADFGAFDYVLAMDGPDPYYGGGDGFTRVLDLIEQASDGLIAALKQ